MSRPRRIAPVGVLLIGVPLVLVLLAVVLGASGCSSTPPPSGIADGPPTDLGEVVDLTGRAEVTISVADNVYTPRAVAVGPGTTVTFENTGANLHNVTPVVGGAFDTVSLSPTESATMTVPTTPGTYRYFCTLHATADSGLQRGAFVVG